MSVEKVDFNKKEGYNKRLRVTVRHRAVVVYEAEYYGLMDGFLDFIGFWKYGDEHPFIVIDGKMIESIEILEEVDES